LEENQYVIVFSTSKLFSLGLNKIYKGKYLRLWWDILGWCINSCGFKNNLFFTQIINYVFSSIIHDCLPTFGEVFDPTLEEIRRFGREEVVGPILELSIVVE
jgi:hypothetical protein